MFENVGQFQKIKNLLENKNASFRFDLFQINSHFNVCILTFRNISEELLIIPVSLDAVEDVPHHLVVAGERHILPNFCT